MPFPRNVGRADGKSKEIVFHFAGTEKIRNRICDILSSQA